MRVYKVVRLSRGKLRSAIMKRQTLNLEYKLGEPTYPEIDGSFIMAFRTRKSAELFAHDLYPEEVGIYEAKAEVVPSNKQPTRIVSPDLEVASIRDFWAIKEWLSTISSVSLMRAPCNTVFCKSLLLKKKIWDGKSGWLKNT